MVSTKECLKAMLNKIEEVVKKKGEGTTMETALEGSFLILCADGAVHPRMQACDQNVITYSMTLSSSYLMNECGFYPTSGAHILPHVQLRGKENAETLRAVMKWRHTDLPASLEGLLGLEDCHVYDLADGKALYLMLDHSHWQCNNHSYLLCKCNRGVMQIVRELFLMKNILGLCRSQKNSGTIAKVSQKIGENSAMGLHIHGMFTKSGVSMKILEYATPEPCRLIIKSVRSVSTFFMAVVPLLRSSLSTFATFLKVYPGMLLYLQPS